MPEVVIPSRRNPSRRPAVVVIAALAVAATMTPIVVLSGVARQAWDVEAAERARADDLARRLADAESRAARVPQDRAARGPSADEDRNPLLGATIPIPLAPPDSNRSGGRPAPPADAPHVRGVVRAVRSINGTRYATVSVGTSQRVTNGMQLKVVDGDDFLSYLTVDSAGPDEAVGHLTGPSVDRVKAGSQVR
jgi:hypothetical protein